MEEGSMERLKYHVIVDGESKNFADSLEKAKALAIEHSKGHLSLKIETVTGVVLSDTWHFDYRVGHWTHVLPSLDVEAQPARPLEDR